MSNSRNGLVVNAAEVNKVKGTMYRTRSPTKAHYVIPSFGAAFESPQFHSSPSANPHRQPHTHASLFGRSNALILATEINEVEGDYRRDRSGTEVTFDYTQARRNTQVPAFQGEYYATAVYESAGGGVYNDSQSQPSTTFAPPRARNHDHSPPQAAYGGTTHYIAAPPQTYGGHEQYSPPPPSYSGRQHSGSPQPYHGNNHSPPQHNRVPNSLSLPGQGNDVYAAPAHNTPAKHHGHYGNPRNSHPPVQGPPAGVSRSKTDMPQQTPAPVHMTDPKIKKKSKGKDGHSRKHRGEVDREGSSGEEEYAAPLDRRQTL
ncbi:hypothetical protein C8R46DRAFT_1076692 [Mycena filopes]|nr:hypothetical protein C8R46DRAFT_1076692 [Mycena filopes]